MWIPSFEFFFRANASARRSSDNVKDACRPSMAAKSSPVSEAAKFLFSSSPASAFGNPFRSDVSKQSTPLIPNDLRFSLITERLPSIDSCDE